MAASIEPGAPAITEVGSRVRAAWLFSARKDVAILALPALTTLGAYVLAASRGHSGESERAYAGWVSQFILGNSTHVILTYLLLAARRDVLHATKGQARIVLVGSAVTFAVTFAMFWVTGRTFPIWTDFGTAIALVFGTHHTVSQVKGIWSLHNLRGKSAGLSPPSDRERLAQRTMVPLALVLGMVRMLFVPKTSTSLFPYIQAIPTLPAVLPFEVTYALVGVWVAFALYVVLAIVPRGAPLSGPKLLYVGSQLGVIGLLVAAPVWGAILASGIHGLEYYVLTARMLEPLPAETRAKLGRALVIPAIVGTLLPGVFIGVGNAPFAAFLGLADQAALFGALRIVLNSVVMAHYFADAFLYRFRIAEVRRVALARLGFA